MDGPIHGRKRCFFNRLTQSRMTVARARNVLCACAILHCKHALRDQLASIGPHDPGAQNAVACLVTDELDLRPRLAGQRTRSGITMSTRRGVPLSRRPTPTNPAALHTHQAIGIVDSTCSAVRHEGKLARLVV
jgi:hypothetical protein